jgi:pimeloyl-ACP methyl ester carboxylesterase
MYFPCKTPPSALQAEAARAAFKPWHNAKGEFIGWFIASQAAHSRTILFFHGNAGCAPGWCPFADGFTAVEPVDFYIMEFPGYGGRPGPTTQTNMLIAAEDAFQSLPKTSSVYLVAESLGTGLATYLAGKHDAQVGGIFLIAPYNNLTAAARRHLPLFPVKWMLKDKYPSDQWLRDYHGPVAVLLAEKDQVVPSDLGRRLFDGYHGPKKLWLETGVGHNNLFAPTRRLSKEVLAFWDAH